MKDSSKFSINIGFFFPVILKFVHYYFLSDEKIPNEPWVYLTIVEAFTASLVFLYLTKKSRIEDIEICNMHFNVNLNMGIQISKYADVFAYMLLIVLTLNKANYWKQFYNEKVEILPVAIMVFGVLLVLFIIWYIATFQARRSLS